eukprot:Gb_29127 [translate_table: standard]
MLEFSDIISVATDGSLHEFLDSYLRFRKRWYDLPDCRQSGSMAGLVVGDQELSRRVFMVLYRMLIPISIVLVLFLSVDDSSNGHQIMILVLMQVNALAQRNIQVVLFVFSSTYASSACGVMLIESVAVSLRDPAQQWDFALSNLVAVPSVEWMPRSLCGTQVTSLKSARLEVTLRRQHWSIYLLRGQLWQGLAAVLTPGLISDHTLGTK